MFVRVTIFAHEATGAQGAIFERFHDRCFSIPAKRF